MEEETHMEFCQKCSNILLPRKKLNDLYLTYLNFRINRYCLFNVSALIVTMAAFANTNLVNVDLLGVDTFY